MTLGTSSTCHLGPSTFPSCPCSSSAWCSERSTSREKSFWQSALGECSWCGLKCFIGLGFSLHMHTTSGLLCKQSPTVGNSWFWLWSFWFPSETSSTWLTRPIMVNILCRMELRHQLHMQEPTLASNPSTQSFLCMTLVLLEISMSQRMQLDLKPCLWCLCFWLQLSWYRLYSWTCLLPLCPIPSARYWPAQNRTVSESRFYSWKITFGLSIPKESSKGRNTSWKLLPAPLAQILKTKLKNESMKLETSCLNKLMIKVSNFCKESILLRQILDLCWITNIKQLIIWLPRLKVLMKSSQTSKRSRIPLPNHRSKGRVLSSLSATWSAKLSLDRLFSIT